MPDEKIIPQNIEAEQSILGALLIDPKAVNKIVDMLKADAFYKENHRHIYETIVELNFANQPIDIVTVAEALKQKNLLEAVGGRIYLTDLSNSVTSSANIEHYAKIVDSKDSLRTLISAGSEMASDAFVSDAELNDILTKAQKTIFQLTQKNIKSDFVPIQEILDTVMENIDKQYDQPGMSGLMTHFSDLDTLLGGIQTSDMVVVAARPSMGKTTFALNVATNIAIKDKIPIGIFSLEMSKESLVQRVVCSEAEVDSHRLKTKNLQDYEWKKIARAISRLSEAPIYIDDTPGISVLELQAKARRLKIEKGIGLIIIDFLTLLSGSAKRPESRYHEVSEITRSIKALARELNVPVIVISQLSRGIEQRQEQTPRMSDLRESGEIEQTSDIILFVHRDDYYDSSVIDNTAKIIVAKHRNGSTGSIELTFRREITKFVNKTREEVPVEAV
jgi:replicative DNA helicase